MKYTVLWTRPAHVDAMRIMEYLYERGLHLQASNFLQALKTRTNGLREMPERGRIVPELRDEGITKYRELVDLQPYRVVYEVRDHTVYIHFIIDGRQDLAALLQDRLLRLYSP